MDAHLKHSACCKIQLIYVLLCITYVTFEIPHVKSHNNLYHCTF